MPIRVSLAALAVIAALFAADVWSSSEGVDAGGLQSTGEAGVRDVSSHAVQEHRVGERRAAAR